MITNKNVKSRVVSILGNARSVYDSDNNALFDGRSSGWNSGPLTYDREDIKIPPKLLYPKEASKLSTYGYSTSSQADNDCLEQLEGKYDATLFDELRDIQRLNISRNSIPAKSPADKDIILGLAYLTYFPTIQGGGKMSIVVE